MAFYLVTRTDEVPADAGEFVEAIVQAHGRRQAERAVTRIGTDVPPPYGVKPDGSNISAARIADDGNFAPRVLLSAHN